MEISKSVFLQVFKSNFTYDLVETEFGQAVKMPARDAFIYSCVTGAGYLDNPIYLFTPNGLIKLFYNAFDYKFVTGIFSNTTLKNTPYIWALAKSYLFNEPKYIVPIEFQSEVKLTEYLKSAFSSLKQPENYIIQRIEASKSGYGMEPFLEYLTAEYFKCRGFIVENQIPLAHAIGSPDFGAYGLSEILAILSSSGYLPDCGFHIIELAMIRINRRQKNKSGNFDTCLIVGEAKSGHSSAVVQLEKYLDTGLFDMGLEIYRSQIKPTKKYLGLISIDSDYKVVMTPPREKYVAREPLSKAEYVKWLINYMKFYLIANFSNDEFASFYHEKYKRSVSSQADIIRFVTHISVETILNKIKELPDVSIK